MSETIESLFGADFEIKIKETPVKDTVKKVKAAKAKKAVDKETDAGKLLKSKKLDLLERLEIINTNVLKVLGKQKENVLVIKDKITFINYISEAIKTGFIAIDTETNNSLDPITCMLMGPCFYYPGGKQAYVPLNHRNPETKERLSWQLTEADCYEQLNRLLEANCKVIMHNGKFDYEVIKCTCGIAVVPYWDTFVGARLLNENEPAGLKWQYVNKIDPTQEKYSIDHLFEHVAYADVDPDIFALYAATDSMMTYKLYLVQLEEFAKPEYGPHMDLTGKHEVKGLRWLFHNVEMPIVVVTAEMELKGVKVDTAFGDRLKSKYENQLQEVDKQIAEEMANLESKILAWRVSPEANAKSRTYPSPKSKMSKEKLEATYPFVDDKGKRYKETKPRAEQLEDPINLASPTQLAILFYDILKAPATNTNSPRGTGEDELKAIYEKCGYEICNLLLKRRSIVKLISTYIDVIPTLATHWPDGRIRFHLNALGTDTGRYSSGGKIKYMENDEEVEVSGINIQNIPSHNPEIRMLFTADTKYSSKIIQEDNYFIVHESEEVETLTGWKTIQELRVGDILVGTESKEIVENIVQKEAVYLVYTKEFDNVC